MRERKATIDGLRFELFQSIWEHSETEDSTARFAWAIVESSDLRPVNKKALQALLEIRRVRKQATRDGVPWNQRQAKADAMALASLKKLGVRRRNCFTEKNLAGEVK